MGLMYMRFTGKQACEGGNQKSGEALDHTAGLSLPEEERGEGRGGVGRT